MVHSRAARTLRLRLRLHPYRCYLVRQRGRTNKAFREHAEFVTAISDGDCGRVSRPMRQHLSTDAELLTDLASALKEDGTFQVVEDSVVAPS